MICNHLHHTGKPLAQEAINPENATVKESDPKICEIAQPDNAKDEEEVQEHFNR